MLMHDRNLRTTSRAENWIARRVRLPLCLLLLLCLPCGYGEASGSSESMTRAHTPPDLTDCTRVEIQYLPNLLDYLFLFTRRPADILNPTELAHMQAMNPIVVEDEARIKVLAQKIDAGMPNVGGYPMEPNIAKVTGYRGGEQVVSFVIMQRGYVLGKNGLFLNEGIALDLLRVATDLGPLLDRRHCASRLVGTARIWYSWRDEPVVRPVPDTWCDEIIAKHLRMVEERNASYPKEIWDQELGRKLREADQKSLAALRNSFRCPTAGEGRCHYAMNSNCTAKSPPDMVFLFEAKAGWNQHGGPELFTFDHHKPKGGIVCLNNFTVKFIRTEEELKQLRWK
jgi:hypothetical protein